jgi:hypothetical protein
MKKLLSLVAIFALVGVGLLVGCKKQETTTPPVPDMPSTNAPAAPAAPAAPGTNAP